MPARTFSSSGAHAAIKTENTPWLNNNGNEIAEISVGLRGILYRIPKQKLIQTIPRFAELLRDHLQMSLPEIGYEEFDLLMEFVDSGGERIRPIFAAKKSEAGVTTSWDPICFFSLAEKFELHNLQNLIMDTIIQHHKKLRELPSPAFAERSYRETRRGSAMSQYALRAVRYSLQTEKEEDESATSRIVTVLGDNRHLAVDFINLLRHGNGLIKDPRRLDPIYHTYPTVQHSNPPPTIVKRQLIPVPHAPIVNKREGEDYLQPPPVKKARFQASAKEVSVPDTVYIKEEYDEAVGKLDGGGPNLPRISMRNPRYDRL